MGDSSSGLLLEVCHIDPFKLAVDLLAQLLQIDCIHLDLSQLVLNRGEGAHGSLDFLNKGLLIGSEILGDQFEAVHLTAVLHSDDLLLLPLLLPNLPLLDLLLALDLLLLLALDDGDALVELGEQVGELGVDLVDEIAEVGAGLVVDALEEHDRGEVLLEVLDLLPRQLPLQDVYYLLLLSALHLLRQTDYLVLERDDAADVAAQLLGAHRVHLDDLCADQLDFIVGAGSDLIDEVPDGQLGALAQDVLDVPALHELHLLDHPQNAALRLARLELALPRPAGLLEQQDPLLEHQKIHEQPLLLAEQKTILVF